jgi:acyl-CoA thioesterase-1
MSRLLLCFIFTVFPALCASQAQPKNFVTFGDSLTAGFGADKSYPEFLQQLLTQNGYPYKVVNAGVSGDTTADGVERMSAVLELKPAIVVLEFGGNDGLRGMPLSTTRANLEQMIVALQKAGAKVVLAGMTLPRNYGQEYIHSFEQIYVDLAKKYKLVRIPFLLEGVAMAGPGLMQQDGIHATTKGNRIVAGTVYKYAMPLLSR